MKYLLILAMAVAAQAACPFGGKFLKLGSEGDCPHAKKIQVDSPQTTIMGCQCTSECQSHIRDGFNCDTCSTENCGKRGIRGRYDFCVYPPNKDYEYQSLEKKMDYLWTKVDADHTPGKYPSALGGFTESVQTSFDLYSDEMTAGRQKVIHSVGSVCKFNLKIAGDSPFTGVLKANNVARGLVRMGSALPVDLKSGVVPGIGVKFLRSNVPSGNLVALYSLAPLPDNSYNFFEKTLSNHIGPAEGLAPKVLGKKFEQKSSCITMVGLSDICKFDNDGKQTDAVEFPFELTFKSNVVQFPSTPITQDKLNEQLGSIAGGTDLFEVKYRADPKSDPRVLGTMTTDGPCVLSKFGDASLFFRHQLVEEDWELQPTWPGYLVGERDCGPKQQPAASNLPRQCPARVLDYVEQL